MKEIRKGQVFRIVDLEGNQAVDTLFYNAHDTRRALQRAVDTIQRAAQPLPGRRARSCCPTAGRPMLTIVADTCGRHDTLGGACAPESNTVRYALDKRYMHTCRDSFLLAMAQHDRRAA